MSWWPRIEFVTSQIWAGILPTKTPYDVIFFCTNMQWLILVTTQSASRQYIVAFRILYSEQISIPDWVPGSVYEISRMRSCFGNVGAYWGGEGGSEMDRACGRVGNHQRVSSLSAGVELYILVVAGGHTGYRRHSKWHVVTSWADSLRGYGMERLRN